MDITSEEGKDMVLVIGHSMVRRAKIAALRTKYWKMDLDDVNISWVGHVNGRTIKGIRDVEEWFECFPGFVKMFDVIIMDIGTNDLQQEFYDFPENLATKIWEVAILGRLLGAKRVAISKVMFRDGVPAIPRNFVSDMEQAVRNVKYYEKQFNSWAHACNVKLIDLVRRTGSGVVMHFHEGLVKEWRTKLVDGLHLTDDGLRKYLKNIKSSSIKLTKDVKKNPNPVGLLNKTQ